MDATEPLRHGDEVSTIAPTTAPGSVAALREAWRLVVHDPVGILVPAMGILLVQGVVIVEAREVAWAAGPRAGLVVGLLGWGGMALVTAPLRVAMLQRGAAAAGLPCLGLRRSLAMAGTQLALAGIDIALLGATAAAFLLVQAVLLAYGWWSLAFLGGGLLLLLAAALSITVRVALAWAPVEVVVRGRSGLGALLGSLQRGAPLRALVAVVGGGLATGMGALLCVAGALPGYPLRDLALLLAYREGSA